LREQHGKSVIFSRKKGKRVGWGGLCKNFEERLRKGGKKLAGAGSKVESAEDLKVIKKH